MSARRPASSPGTAGDQVARLLTLVPYLQAHPTVRLAEAADALGVTPEQLVGDLKVLWMCGLPGGLPDDLIDVDMAALESDEGTALSDGVVTIGNADYLSRPIRLTPTEASAIIVALRALRSTAGDEAVPAIDRALAKLEQAAAAGPATVALADGDDGREARLNDLGARLASAASRQVQVELDYFVPTRDEMSHRTVDPHGVVEHDGHDYLDAWCHLAEAPRLFRLDRIAEATVLDVPVATEPQEPRDLSGGVFAATDDLTTVTLRLRPQARWIVEYYPVVDVRPVRGARSGRDAESGGLVDVDLQVADTRWLTKLMLRLAPNASVVEPADLGQAVAGVARDVLALYDPPARTIEDVDGVDPH